MRDSKRRVSLRGPRLNGWRAGLAPCPGCGGHPILEERGLVSLLRIGDEGMKMGIA